MAIDTEYGLAPAASSPSANAYGLELVNPYGLQRAAMPQTKADYGLTPVTAPAQTRPVPSTWDHIAATVGRFIPEAATPGLATAKRYFVDPFERAAQAGAETFSGLAEATGAELHYGYSPAVKKEAADIARYRTEHPIEAGAVRGVGSVVGGTVVDPRNWPFFGSSAARPILQRIISSGFGTQMGVGAISGARELLANWDKLTPMQRSELATRTGISGVMSAASIAHAVSSLQPEVTTKPGETKASAEAPPPARAIPDSSTVQGVSAHNEAFEQAKAELGPKADVRALLRRAQEILTQPKHVPVNPASPLGSILRQQAPDIRVIDSSAAAHGLLERDTIVRPGIQMRDYAISDPELVALESQLKGRSEEVARKYPVQPVSSATEAGPKEGATVRVTGPSGIAAFRNTARIVSDNHIPVVSQDRVLTESIQNILNNSDELRRAGIDVSQINTGEDVDAALARASDLIKGNLDGRAAATISFEAQKGLAADLGMTVEELLARKSGQAFNSEQALAARALLNQSAKNVVRLSKLAAERGGEPSLTAATTALAQHQALQEKVAGITAESGRALGSFRISDESLPQVKIANILSKLPKAAQAKAAQLLSKIDPNDARQVNAFIEEIRPSSTADKIFEYYRNALLSSPKTVTVKAASEAAMMALEATKKVVAAGISRVKDPTPERFASEAWWYAKGAMQALQHTKAILTDQFALQDAPGFEGTGRQAIKGPIGPIVRFPGTVLARQTNLMYVLNLYGEINALAAREAIKEGLSGQELHARQEFLAANPTPEMSEQAHQVALHNTFQSQLGKFGKIVQGAIRNDPSGTLRYLFPFTKVPTNLAKASAEFSPYGLFKGLVKGDVDAQARGLIGSSLAAGIAYLALNGLVTGGGVVNWRKKQTEEAAGFQPYSLKIGDKYYAYHRWEPLGLVFGLVADAVHGMKTGDSEMVSQSKADNAVTHIERNLSDLPFLFQLSSIVDAIKDTSGKRIDNFIARQIASFIPAAVANVAEATDRTIRHPGGNTLPEIVKQTVQSRLPGLTKKVPAVVDIAGHEMQRPASALGGGNAFVVTTAKNDAVLSELSRLGISTPQPPSQITWRGKKTQLTDAEREQFARDEGAEFYKRAAKMVRSSAWSNRNDDQKRKALIQLHRLLDESRAQRLTRIRRQSQAELARDSL